MSLAIFDALRVVLAALFSGIAVKIMDDSIDREYDAVLGFPNSSNKYGAGVAAYGMLSLLLACICHTKLAVALFTAAYAVGMGFTDTAVYPTRLTGRGEVLLAFIVSLSFTGMRMTVLALSVMLGAQLIDNWIDEQKGLLYPVAALAVFCLAVLCSTKLALLVLFAYALFFALERVWHLCL